MMEMISRHFSKIMGGVALVIVILGSVGGLVLGLELGKGGVMMFIGMAAGLLVGFLGTYVIVVMVFGFMAQVVSINSHLERIEEILEEREE